MTLPDFAAAYRKACRRMDWITLAGNAFGALLAYVFLSLLFPVFAAVIIGGASLSGGRGTAIGTLSGALLLAIIQDGLALLSVGAYLQQFVQGTVTIGAVVLDRFTAGRRR